MEGTRRKRGNARLQGRGGQARPSSGSSYARSTGAATYVPSASAQTDINRGGEGSGRGSTARTRRTHAESEVVQGRATSESEWKGKVVRIISGGETGADLAGLEAGRLLKVATGGTAPRNFLTEKGPDPTLQEYGLVDGKTGFSAITRKNVDDSDGTIAFRLRPGNGTDKTIGWAQHRKWGYGVDRGRSKDDGWRPVLVINDVSDEHLEENCQRIREWIQRHKIAIVNIAGHRETTSGMGPLFAAQVTKILGHALADLV